MKIWIIKHCYDNGESYEDYRDYERYEFYSTFNKAYKAYCEHLLSDYKGRYYLIEKTLDTQEEFELEKSPWINCSSQWDTYLDDCRPSQEDYESEIYAKEEDPDLDLFKWRYPGAFEGIDYLEEGIAEHDYLHHAGNNYLEWQECQEELDKRVKDAQLLTLLNNLNELLK